MTSNPIFRGVATALVTPTTENGVDYEALGRLIDWQIEEGINALVIAGTTGEGSTLTVEEHKEVIRIELTKSACEDGVDACLVVTPYYNKATQNGLIAMYKAIADASTKPIIMYNVPSRTGVNIEPSTYAALAGYPNIAAIKEANGNISKIVEAAGAIGDQLDMYSGNDDQVVPILSMGGSGVISVVSNVAPRRTVEMCDRYFAGDVASRLPWQQWDTVRTICACLFAPCPKQMRVQCFRSCVTWEFSSDIILKRIIFTVHAGII